MTPRVIAVSVGAGRTNPRARRERVAADVFGPALMQHGGDEAWWSPCVWRGDYRKAANFEQADVLAIDVDHTPSGEHAPMPDDTWTAAEAALAVVSHHWRYRTPRGCRLVLLLADAIKDADTYTRATRALAARTQEALNAAGIGDVMRADMAATDAARFLYTPRATVDGAHRISEVVAVDVSPSDVADVIASAPVHEAAVSDCEPQRGNAPPVHIPPGTDPAKTFARLRAWIAEADPAVEKQRGQDTCFRIACKIAAHSELTRDRQWELLLEYNARCIPPWDISDAAERAELERKLDEARRVGRAARLPDRPSRRSGAVPVPAMDATVSGARPEIRIGVEVAPMVDAAVAAIAVMDVYQRDGRLVDVIREASEEDGMIRPAGAPRLREIPGPRLQEQLGSAASWLAFRPNKRAEGDGEWKGARPPKDMAALVAARGEWAQIRPLIGAVSYPVLAPDGSVVTRGGYDARTRLIVEPSVDVHVPDRPTRDDARRAVVLISEYLCDFPFESEAHRAAWLAALLTPLARPAIDGPTPLTLIDANTRSAGKTLLASLIGAIVMGSDLPRRTAPAKEEEWGKVLLTLLLAADPIVLIDNVTGVLRSAALDAVLTGSRYVDRILGKSEQAGVSIRTVFVATSNNAQISTDLVRRSLHVRLESPEERPERRNGYRWPHLYDSVLRDRRELLAAALTILRAYVVAGRPRVNQLPLASYEAWSAVVRAPLIWLGLEDPARTQDGLREHADIEGDEVADLLAAWHAAVGDRPITAASLIRHSQSMGSPELKDALADREGEMPSSGRLGCRLRKLRGVRKGGFVLERPRQEHNTGMWRVLKLSTGASAAPGAPGHHPGGDGGFRGDISGTPRAREITQCVMGSVEQLRRESPPIPPSPPDDYDDAEVLS